MKKGGRKGRPCGGGGGCIAGTTIGRPIVRPAPVFAGGAQAPPLRRQERWAAEGVGPYTETLVCAVGADALGGPNPRLWTPSVSRLAGDGGCHLPRRGRQGGTLQKPAKIPEKRLDSGLLAV